MLSNTAATDDNPFALLLVATDGVANDLLRAGLPAARDWSGALAATLRAATSPEQAAARLAAWLAAYRAPGSWDDRTLKARRKPPRFWREGKGAILRRQDRLAGL